MKTIYKYPLKTIDTQEVILPNGHEILTVQEQHGEIQMWVLIDTARTRERVIIETFGTGHQIKNLSERKYIATYQLEGGDLVFHVFEYLGQ